ncbi:hypothetical protein [Clostridium gasigenes]|nr:hypothetical protein [Clostridium gasigenes]
MIQKNTLQIKDDVEVIKKDLCFVEEATAKKMERYCKFKSSKMT